MKADRLGWLKKPFDLSSLREKLILFFLGISLLPLIGVGLIAYSLSQNALRDEAFSQIAAVRNLKASQIEAYFEDVDEDIQLTAQLPNVQIAFFELSNHVSTFGLDEIRKLGFLGQPNLTEIGTYHLYSDRHRIYHPFFSEIVRARAYEDILLVSLDGDVVYSYAKRDEFATNLVDGPYDDTLLGQVFREVKNSPEGEGILMSDYIAYPPANNRPISFVATLIEEPDIGVVGVLVYALSLDQISAVVEDKAGLETVESYIVGSDKMMRSTSEGTEKPINTVAVEQGLQGITSAKPIWNGEETLFTAYQPIEIAGLKWVLVTEEAETDALAGANIVGFWIIFGIMGAMVLVIVVGLLMGLRIANPISRLTEVARQIAGGHLEARAEVESQDEIGELAEAINSMTAQLHQTLSTLEEQVQERTADLALSVEVGQRVTTIRDMNVLLSTVTEFIWDQFGLFYVQVFLVDDIKQNLVLRAATGQAGQELLSRNLSLPINTDTTVGRSVIERQSIVVSDTTVGGLDMDQQIPASWYATLIKKEQEKRPASLLPESLSELAIPLIVEGQVLGVLDLQDDKLRSFTEKDLSVYEAIAVQLSISIDSAHQWELAQEAQQRAEQAVQQLTREAWMDRLGSSRQTPGFVYDLSRVSPITSSLSAEDDFSVPLVVQDQSIGQIAVQKPPDRGWTDDEQALVQSIAQQLAQKAENLRLFEATQQRASREQIARRIIDKVRASRTIETALEVAAEELNRVLGTAKATIDLQITSSETVDDGADNASVDREPTMPTDRRSRDDSLGDETEDENRVR